MATSTTARAFLGTNDVFTASNTGGSVFGGGGTDTVTLSPGAAGVVLDQLVEKVVLSGALASYRFKQAGNQISVYDSAGTTLIMSAPVQTDTDGTVLSFSDGQASVRLQAGGIMKLGAATVSSNVLSLVTALDAATPNTTTQSKAQIFLGASDTFTASNNGLTIFGGSGTDSVTVDNGFSGIVMDQNVESVGLGLAPGNYTLQQSGNQINVYNANGTMLLVSLPVQTDSDGTVFDFAGARFSATLQTGGVMKVGTAIVSAQTPSALNLSGGTVSLATKAAAFGKTESGIGTLLDSANSSVLSLATADKWSSTNLTYSFNTSVPAEYAGVSTTSTPSGTLTANWSALNSTQKAAVNQIFGKLGSLIPVNFTEAAGNTGDVRFNMVSTTSTVAGFAYLPSTSALGGDVFLSDRNRSDTYAPGSSSYGTMVHELGHAMGLKHPFESPNVLSTALDNDSYTVMSYTPGKSMLLTFTASGSQLGVSGTYTAEPASWSILDIAALQSMYGANSKFRTGDDTYTVSFSQHAQLAIWDAGGNDTINAASATGACTVDLRAGQLSSFDVHTIAMQQADTLAYYQSIGVNGADSFVAKVYADPKFTTDLFTGENSVGIAYGVWIENVNTGSAADTVRDNAANNSISTGGGNDTISLFEGGFDTVDGGSGTDTVRVNDTLAKTQTEKQADGSYLVVGSYYAAKLVGVESIVCADGTITLV